MPTVTSPSGATSTDGTIPSDTMSAPSSGSMTVPSTTITSSTVGGAGVLEGLLDRLLEGVTVMCGILPAKSV